MPANRLGGGDAQAIRPLRHAAQVIDRVAGPVIRRITAGHPVPPRWFRRSIRGKSMDTPWARLLNEFRLTDQQV